MKNKNIALALGTVMTAAASMTADAAPPPTGSPIEMFDQEVRVRECQMTPSCASQWTGATGSTDSESEMMSSPAVETPSIGVICSADKPQAVQPKSCGFFIK